MLIERGPSSFQVACRLGFAVPELVVNVYPGSQMVQLCIPVLVAAGIEMFGITDDSVEVVLRSFIHVVHHVHKMVWSDDMSDGENLVPCIRAHKAEVQTLMGFTCVVKLGTWRSVSRWQCWWSQLAARLGTLSACPTPPSFRRTGTPTTFCSLTPILKLTTRKTLWLGTMPHCNGC